MTSTPPVPPVLGSQLLGELLSAFAPDQRSPLRILDLGPASAATVTFFSQFRCTLQFADLDPALLHPPSQDQEEPVDRQTRLKQLRAQLGLPLGSTFDLCLCWDMLNHLDESGLRTLGEVLAPHLHRASRGHGFTVHNRGAELYHRSYGILDTGQLLITDQSRSLRLRHSHSQSTLNSQLGCLTVKRSVLRSDGRLEMALAAKSLR